MKILKWLNRLFSRKCECGGIKEDLYWDGETNLMMEKCLSCNKENLH